MANVYTLQNIKDHRLGKRKGLNQDLFRNNTEIQKLRTHVLQVINEHKQLQNENTNLISHNAQKDIFIAESKTENITKSKKIRSLESMIKILESKLSLAQKNVFLIQKTSSNKESKVLSLKSKITELEHELGLNISELERLKSKNMSVSIVDQAGKINNIISDHTDNKSIAEQWLKEPTPIPEFPRVDTEIIPKISDEIDISKANNNIPQEIPKIPIEGIEAIPIALSTLMSSLSAYIFLTLLIIAVMWFIILRRTWNMGKKSNRLWDTWVG
ncbi:hypothetical protein C2G38_2229119 [Gigaspora rosea]|uniref:Uncharacterized protein n=1 Tax=Gigaspora rosea TaxID=44941 RepID=A0A397TYG2_9GLOM|nr:hypothetical protein C2G38_2229119 [Gigaspora rosea]